MCVAREAEKIYDNHNIMIIKYNFHILTRQINLPCLQSFMRQPQHKTHLDIEQDLKREVY